MSSINLPLINNIACAFRLRSLVQTFILCLRSSIFIVAYLRNALVKTIIKSRNIPIFQINTMFLPRATMMIIIETTENNDETSRRRRRRRRPYRRNTRRRAKRSAFTFDPIKLYKHNQFKASVRRRRRRMSSDRSCETETVAWPHRNGYGWVLGLEPDDTCRPRGARQSNYNYCRPSRPYALGRARSHTYASRPPDAIAPSVET